MRLSILISTFVVSAALAGPELDRARRNTTQARSALDRAEARLEAARASDDAVRIEMDRIRDKQRDVDRKIDRLRDLRRDLPMKQRDLEAKLPAMSDELTAAGRELARLQEPLREKITVAKQTLAKVKATRAHYVKQFEISEAYQHAVIRAELAAKFQVATQRGVLDRTRSSADYKAAQLEHARARSAQSTVKLNVDATAAERIAAADRVIQTEAAMVKLENDALASDETLSLARASARRSELALKALIEQFEKDLPLQPDMVEVTAEHAKAQKAADEADAAMSKVEARLTAANEALISTRAAITKLKDDLIKTEADLAAVEKEGEALSRDLDVLGRRLTDNGAIVAQCQRDVDAAERRYQQARAYEAVAARIDEKNENK